MLCENEYCIYQKNRKCTLDAISINEFGNCSECIIPNIPSKILEKIKKERLEILESEDNQKTIRK